MQEHACYCPPTPPSLSFSCCCVCPNPEETVLVSDYKYIRVCGLLQWCNTVTSMCGNLVLPEVEEKQNEAICWCIMVILFGIEGDFEFSQK